MEQRQEKIDNRQFIDFGTSELIYSNKKILFFNFKDNIYFKAKDIANL
jgi:hypothetical protein